MSATINYKGNIITTVENTTKTLNTAGTWLEDDIVIEDTTSSATALVVDTPDAGGGVIKSITVENMVNLQHAKSVIYNGQQVTVTPDDGYDGFSSVVVDGRRDMCVPKDVNFVDYDGQLLYSYTVTQFMELTELPPNPTNPGLIAQGWNWDLDNAKEQVQTSGQLVIGQIYIPTDGKTHIFIEILNTLRKTMCLYFGCSKGNGVVVDWGDGTVETISSTAMADHLHTYADTGSYEITIEVTTGTISWGGSHHSIAGADNTNFERYFSARTFIRKIYFGNGFTTFGQYSFSGLQRLQVMTIPDGVTSIASYGGYNNVVLKALIFPKTLKTYSSNAFQQLYSLCWLSIPNGVTTIPQRCFAQIYEINNIIIPNTVKTLVSGAFYRANAVTKIVIPESVTSIGNEAFYQCYSLKEFHLLPTTPPTLGNTNAFTGIVSDCIFYVPYSEDHSILEAYKSATNWSTYAAKMQEEPQS